MEHLGQFRLLERLGAGGMGEVYRARDEKLQRDVAIKVLPASSFTDATARGRLVREARAAAALNHPNICTVFDVGEASEQAYIAMECVDGEPLDERIAKGTLLPADVVRFGIQLADALAHAHDRGVVHRDLKPGNVIITPENRLKVLDFGLAKRVEDEVTEDATTTPHLLLTAPGLVVGTPAYMSPEQLRGLPADARSDVWAAGVMLYEMLSGDRPFAGNTWPELSASILTEAPKPLPGDVPVELQAVISRCLAKQAADRYQRAGEVRAALEALQTGFGSRRSVPQPSAETAPATVSVTFARTRLITAAVAVAVIAGGLTTWRFWPATQPSRSLAVLPLANPAGDPSIEYLCDGLMENVIQHVARLRSVRVAPMSAAMHFKGKPEISPREAGRRLGVENVLSGTLSRQGGRLTIAVELLDVGRGSRVWSQTYERTAGDLLKLQNEVASAIAGEGLRLHLTPADRQQLARNLTTDAEAYDLYLQARYVQRRATADDYLHAQELVQRAIVRDPAFAEAYALLAGIYAMLAVDGLERPTDAWPQTNRYMRKALEIDPDLPSAHFLAHTLALFFDWDWAGAERERKLLLEMAATNHNATWMRPMVLELWALGRAGEALELARRMRELDRLSPDLIRLEADYLAATGQLDAAVGVYERAVRSDPNDPNTWFGLAEVLFRQARFEEAIKARRQAHESAGDGSLADVFSRARGEQGYREINRRWVELQLATLTERAAGEYVSPLDFARAYAQLGETEQAFRYLEAAFADRAPGLIFLKVDRAWDAIRDDGRFAAAVRRVGLP